MITYPISSNYVKISCLQCYRLYNFPFFRSNQWRCYNRKFFVEILQNSQENARSKVSFLISCKLRRLLLIFLVSTLEDFLFISFRQKNEMKKREISWWNSNIYFFARVSISLTWKISKKIWQMVIWSENVFKEDLFLQFSCYWE